MSKRSSTIPSTVTTAMESGPTSYPVPGVTVTDTISSPSSNTVSFTGTTSTTTCETPAGKSTTPESGS